MALTAAQTAKVRMYLGYARAMGGGDPLQRALPGLPTETVDLVVEILEKLETVETQIGQAAAGQYISRVEDITFSGNSGLASLRGEGRRYCNRLASVIGVPVMNDVFAAQSVASSGPLLRG